MPTTGDADVELGLSDGSVAKLVAQEDGWVLLVDGVRQSALGPAGTTPGSAYVRWILAVLGSDRGHVLHLGGGLLALPRAVAARTPGTRQVVVESEPAVVELVRQRFGLPPGVTVVAGDARAWLEAGHARACDAIVVDVFAGGRIPAAFTSREFFAHARAALAGEGLLVVSSVAGPELLFTRRELATLQELFAHVAMVVQGSVLQGLRFGNAVLVASTAPLDVAAIRAGLAGDPSRGALVTDIAAIVDGAAPVTDADDLRSPVPVLPGLGKALAAVEALRRTAEAARDAAAQGKTPRTTPRA